MFNIFSNYYSTKYIQSAISPAGNPVSRLAILRVHIQNIRTSAFIIKIMQNKLQKHVSRVTVNRIRAVLTY